MKIKSAIFIIFSAVLLFASTYCFAAPTIRVTAPSAGSTITGPFDITGTVTFDPGNPVVYGSIECTIGDAFYAYWVDKTFTCPQSCACSGRTCSFSLYSVMNQLISPDMLDTNPMLYTLSCTATDPAAATDSFNIYVDPTLHVQPGNDFGRPDDAQDDCSKSNDQSGSAAPSGAGSPVWWVNKVNLNLYMTDTPLWYKPPYGPSVNIQLSYNSQGSAPGSPFGSKWQFNYASYIIENSGSATIVMPDGKTDVYTLSSGVYQKPFGVFNTLVNTGASSYTLTFLDGTVYTYSKPLGVSRPVLTDIKDAYNNHLSITYNSNGQIVSITDALNSSNSTTNITYNTQGYIATITDPFVIDGDTGAHRTAQFTYHPGTDLLWRVTDMGGYWSEYTYDANGYLSSITSLDPSDPTHTQTRTRTFSIEPSDSAANPAPYPDPNAAAPKMGKKYRVTVGNPDPNNVLNYLKEEYFYDGSNTWYVSPRNYVTYVSSVTNNMNDAVKTYYQLERYPANSSTPKGRIFKIITSERQTATYYYDDSTGSNTISGYTYANTGKKALIIDGNNHSNRYQYNQNGLVTYFWDATVTSPTSSNWTFSYTYYPNNIDVQTIDNHLGNPASYQYNGFTHDVSSVTDHLTPSITTAFGYDTLGRLSSIVEAQGTAVQKQTNLNYDPTTYTLSNISVGLTVVKSFTYDNIGRIQSVAYPDGVSINYFYDNLNQTRTISYPDGRNEIITSSLACPYVVDSTTDAAGVTTIYTHDCLKRLTQKNGPDGLFKYGYDANSNLISLTDPMNNVTSFAYNLDNRLKQKTYPDATKFVSYTYDSAGLLKTFTNARSKTTTYGYDANNNLNAITYTDGTPNVSMIYDAYNRLSTMTDGFSTIGNWVYTYDADNRLHTATAPWANDTVTYVYNELNQLKTLTPQGGTVVNYTYDSIGRLKTVQRSGDTNPFNYDYDTSTSASPLVSKLTRPNGSYTTYEYNDQLKKLTGLYNKTSGNNLINSYLYTYTDPKHPDFINSETSTNGLVIDNFINATTTYVPNNLNQIASETNPNRTYSYDNDGNMTGSFTPDGYALTMTYDAENRMISAQFTDGQSKIHLTNYYYSGDGLLAEMKKTVGGVLSSDTRYIRSGFLPMQERDGSNSVTREYLWGANYGGGIGGLLNLKQSGADYNYLYDGKGNVTTLTDGTQSLVATYAYDQYGVLMKKSGTLDQPYMFSTKPYDSENGHVRYEFRFYDPILGKWMTKDPLGEGSDPNLYRMVANNPANWVDSLGLCVEDACVLEGVGLGLAACLENPACANLLKAGAAALGGAIGNLCNSFAKQTGDKNKKYQKPANPNQRKGAEERKKTGERERNVGHPDGEEHSRVPKGPIKR